jgi:protocatechuate 3,4-dioxygenase, alpha subunit
MNLRTSTSQTVGPFFHLGLSWLCRDNLAPEGVSGERYCVQGRVVDGDGAGVPDAILEIWQANSHGKYAHPEDTQDKPLESQFHGYGRVPTDQRGTFRFTTIKPGPVSGPDGEEQAPHLVISIFMRGLLKRLVTRMYFPGELRNESDPVLGLVQPERLHTLLAKRAEGSPASLEWNVILQGAEETVFFDVGL